jgi:hypothetical protein
MGPCFQIRIVLLAVYSVKSRLHVVNGAACHQFAYLLNVILDCDRFVFSTVTAVYRVVEYVILEPLCVVEGYIKVELFTILLTHSHMT